MEEDETLVLYKNNIRIKFDRVVKKGSSFVMYLKINPCFLDQVKIGTEESVEKKKAKEKKAVDFIESLGHPSEELKIVTSKATAKSKCIELNNKGGAKWLVSRNFGKVGETRKVIYVGKMFGEIYDLENYLAYQARR
jgi:hypothetical protein